MSSKVLVTCFVLALSVGYFVSLLQVNNRTSFNFKKTELHFRGSPAEEEMRIPQSDATMISVAHVHSFSQPVVLGIMGLLFALSSVSEGGKIFWIIFSFAGSLGSVAGPWLIRDVSPKSVYLLHVAGAAMFVSFVVMASRILSEVWGRGGRGNV